MLSQEYQISLSFALEAANFYLIIKICDNDRKQSRRGARKLSR